MKKLDTLVVATWNPGKRDRYLQIFAERVNNILVLNDLNIKEKAVENGSIAEENAEIKAKFYLNKTNLPTFSEDESLFVDFLPDDKQPGVHVRRINGKDEVSDDELLKYWENIIRDVPEEKRTGYWHTAFCLALPTGEIVTGSVDYPIQFFSKSSIYIKGWPLSSIQGSALIGKPHSEYTREENAYINKRAEELLLEKLNELIN